jgi:molybdate transport system substrate-binding protein
LSSTALEAVLRKLSPQIERATGARLQLHFDTSLALRTAIEQGSAFDVGILTADDIPPLTTSGRLLPGASVDIARSGIGMVVRAGSPRPDIASVDAFKRSLLAAHSVAYSATGASGRYFEQLLQRLGLAATVDAKARRPRGGLVAELIARGDAELGAAQISELMGVVGVDYIGPLPESLQHYTVFTGCLNRALADSHAAVRARAARALITYLTGSEARAAMRAQGMQPISVRPTSSLPATR